MAVHSYVLSKYMSLEEKDRLQLDVNQMKEHGSYAIANPKALIAFDMFAALESMIDSRYSEDAFCSLLNKDGRYRIALFDENEKNLSVVISVNNVSRQYFYEVKGVLSVRQVYYVSQIPEERVCYLVSEHIIGPEPGVGLIERCYRPYFRELLPAQRYLSLKMKNYDPGQGSAASGFRMFVVDETEIEASQWYQDNMTIARQIKEYDLDAEEYRYLPTEEVFGAIRAKAYDVLPASEKAVINREIYDKMREYVPEDELPLLDEEIEQASHSDIEYVTDRAIIMALANAETQETFDAIYKDLACYEYRIGALTDDIFNEHPDEGFILASTSGELRWYEECYFIGIWEQAKGNPYFGKFQLNENDTLLSFRQFRPDLYVDSFPDEKTMRYWKDRYLDETAAARGRHDEMRYRTEPDGRDIVMGDWYFQGLHSKRVAANIWFYRTYGSHTFTEEECKKLLSGEELVIEHFISKADLETTIRGKLHDCSSPYDENLTIAFARTDINVSKDRMMLDAELGIVEEGLPPAVET